MLKSKLFVAHITQRIGEYETNLKRLILAKDLAEAELYAFEEGMPTFDGSDLKDKNSYQEGDQPHTWYFAGGDWCVTLKCVTEVDDEVTAEVIVKSSLVSFL
jgi:hypothetical protein